MSDRLFITVLGTPNSGKTHTWKTLFGKEVRTGVNVRVLEVLPGHSVKVFLVSGSAEERGKYVGDLIRDPAAQIVLCSVQYIEDARATFNYAKENGFEVHTQWLNPGHDDKDFYFDFLGFIPRLTAEGHTLSIRNGKGDPSARVHEIRERIFGWAYPRSLVF